MFGKALTAIFACTALVLACSSDGPSGGGNNTPGPGQGGGPGQGQGGNTGLPGGAGVGGSTTLPGAGSGVGPSSGGSVINNGGAQNVGGAQNPTAGAAGTAVNPPQVCSEGVVPVAGDRCDMGVTTALGTALIIDDFEDPGEDSDYLGVFFGDGRSGKWFEAHDATLAPVVSMAVEATTGGPEGNTRALRYQGGAPQGWGATLGIPVAACYDASAYRGVSFYIRGNPAAGNAMVKFSIHTPISEPVASGGACGPGDEALGRCYDHYAKLIPVTDQWVRHNIPWGDLTQNCLANPAYEFQKEILTFSFSITDNSKGFDFSIDNFSFDTGDLPSDSFATIVSKPAFEEMWQTTVGGVPTNLRNPFYTYEGLLTAIGRYPAFCTTGSAVQRRREAAMFLSNVAHETDSLALVEEVGCANDTTCSQYGGTAPNGATYHGRGPIQLTWNYNYEAAGAGLGLNLVGNPELVATDPAVAFSTAMWFWMDPSRNVHAAVSQGLGATIRVINSIECNGGNTPAVNNRIRHYRRFCNMLGVDPGTGLGC